MPQLLALVQNLTFPKSDLIFPVPQRVSCSGFRQWHHSEGEWGRRAVAEAAAYPSLLRAP